MIETNLEEHTQHSFSSTRTYSAKEAVRLAREKVRRNDVLVSSLMKRSELENVDSGPTSKMEFDYPGQLERPSKRDVKTSDEMSDTVESKEGDQSSDETTYRIKTGHKILSMFRDLFD